LVTGAVAWKFRDEIRGLYHSQVESRLRNGDGRSSTTPASPADSDPSVGTPSTRALRSAERKEARIAQPDGPAYVVLTADEMASLVDARLDTAARQALDSLRVSLAEDRFIVEGQIRTDAFSVIVGPLAGFLAPREPLRAAGPARLQRAGVIGWRPDEFALRSFPLPAGAIPHLVNQVTGGDDGAFHISVPPTVGDVRVRPDGVTFYRWVR
jgi:hypothetical protein